LYFKSSFLAFGSIGTLEGLPVFVRSTLIQSSPEISNVLQCAVMIALSDDLKKVLEVSDEGILKPLKVYIFQLVNMLQEGGDVIFRCSVTRIRRP
jgi:hypothetical protein